MLLELFYYLRLCERRRWSPARRRQRQERLLRELVRRAFDVVPFYRSWYEEAGIRPEQIWSLDDLSQLPIVRKSDVRRREPETPILANDINPDRCRMVQTSGSSGIPMKIYFSRREEAIRAAAFHRGMVDMVGRFYFRALRVGSLRPERRSLLGAMNPRKLIRKTVTIEAAEETARVFRPHVVTGLVSQLHVLALHLRDRGVESIHPRMVTVGGEMLLPPTRRLLEDVFQAPVLPFYGAWEFGLIAASCVKGGGYHMCTDDLLVECLKDGRPAGPGEQGEITITSLTARTMPFIRYAIGDIGVVTAHNCDCGHPYGGLESLEGRSDDLLVMADGRVVTPFAAAHPLYRLTELDQFRVIQEAPRKFVVHYVSKQPLEDGKIEGIHSYFSEELLAEKTVVTRVAEIPPDPSGKIRKFISHVR